MSPIFDGHLTYGGVEIINTERLQAYADNGLVPVGTTVEACTYCTGVSEALGLMEAGTWTPYRTPILDRPPWFDEENSDTWDFAGVLPLGITGLDGSTGVVDITETIRGGGVAGRRRYTPRTIAVSALLVGRTTESVQAGLAWLTTALHRNCAADDACGPVAALDGFTACPGPVCTSADLEAPPVSETQEALDITDWFVRNATFEAQSLTHADLCPLFDPADTLDGGPFDEEPPGDPMDGGTFALTGAPGIDGGTFDIPPDPSVLGILGGIQRGPIAGPVTISWELLSLAPDVDNQTGNLVLLDEVGEVAVWGPSFDVPAGAATVEWHLPPGIDLDNWRAGLVTSDPGCVGVVSVTVEYQPQLTIAECVAPYQRSFPQVATVAGPTVVGVVANDDCADWLRVEWTWVAGSPYRYGVPDPLIIGGGVELGAEAVPVFQAPGVSYSVTVDTPGTPWHCAVPVDPAVCYTDPCNPGFVAPPAAPFVADPSRVTITTEDINDIAICLDPSAVPSAEGVLTIALRNDSSDKVGIRVRVWDDVEPGCTPAEVCDFAYEYQIDYIPPDGILTIDGTTGQITTLCDDRLEDASAIVRGDWGGPVKDPVISCDRRYLIHVQYLNAYPRTCDGFYVSGQPEGDLLVDVSVTPREG